MQWLGIVAYVTRDTISYSTWARCRECLFRMWSHGFGFMIPISRLSWLDLVDMAYKCACPKLATRVNLNRLNLICGKSSTFYRSICIRSICNCRIWLPHPQWRQHLHLHLHLQWRQHLQWFFSSDFSLQSNGESAQTSEQSTSGASSHSVSQSATPVTPESLSSAQGAHSCSSELRSRSWQTQKPSILIERC